MTIVQLAPARLWIDVPAHELARVTARVTAREQVLAWAEGAADRPFSAQLDVVSPTVDPASRSVRVRYRTANEGLALREGMLVTVEVELARREDVVLAPLAALQMDVGRNGAAESYTGYVLDGDVARRRTIRLGLDQDGAAGVIEDRVSGPTTE